MGQTTEERIIAESIVKLREDAEYQFRSTIQNHLRNIVECQKAVTVAMLNLAKAREHIKTLKLEVIEPIV
jgi:hypothetical protein